MLVEIAFLLKLIEMKQKNALSIDAQAGRNIRYHQTQLKLKPGTHWYEIPWPENKKRASNLFMIQMPDYIGEVYPFRFVELSGYQGDLKAPQVVRTMVNYTFEESASSADNPLIQLKIRAIEVIILFISFIKFFFFT